MTAVRGVIAIDPGYAARGHGCACARLDSDHTLDSVWFARPTSASISGDVSHVVVEQPQQDERSRGVPPEVLIRLSWDGALLAGLYAGAAGAVVVALTPADWKGSTSKPVAHHRMWAVLSSAERLILGGAPTGDLIAAARRRGALDRWGRPGAAYYPARWEGHNLLDAVALALTFVGRLTK